jgi:O-antigen/teichoic acid export membrane protein
MDKKKGFLNVIVSLIFKIVLLFGSIFVRRFVIQYIGNEINGLNSLYGSILDMLAVAELGVGTAITFCMYKPIVEGDNDKVSALYHLFTKLYLIIGAFILVAGCIVMFFLPYLAKDYQDINVNLYATFALTLASVVISYLFSSKTSLINAYKNNYVVTIINNVGIIFQYLLQIFVIIKFQSYEYFLVCRIVSVLLQWLATEIYSRRNYGYLIKNKQSIDVNTKKDIVKNIKAMFMHKIGGVLVNTADSIIISAFIGVVILGKYTNYTTIMSSMVGVITLFFSPLTSVIGHMCVEEDSKQIIKYSNFFHTFNFVLGMIFFLGYYAIIDNLVIIFFGSVDLELGKTISFVITLNYFIQFMRQATLLFRDATGTFYNDRWKPLVEGSINVVLSILFVLVLPDEYKVVGVIVATIITNILICHIVEPHVLYKYAFKQSAKKYYVRNYLYIAIFALALIGLNFCMIDIENQWLELLVNGCISVGFSFVICTVTILVNKDFRHYIKVFIERIKDKFRRKKVELN